MKRPLLRTQPVSEFGDFDAAAMEGLGAEVPMDNTYVPGFSDLRHRRDLELAEVAEQRRMPDEVSSLPVNVRLVRRASAGGTFDGARLMKAAGQGYKPVTKEMVGQDWLTALPPGARVMEDGSLVNAAGDMQYMYCEADRAALNQYRKTQKMLDMAAMAGQKISGGAEENTAGSFGKKALSEPLLD